MRLEDALDGMFPPLKRYAYYTPQVTTFGGGATGEILTWDNETVDTYNLMAVEMFLPRPLDETSFYLARANISTAVPGGLLRIGLYDYDGDLVSDWGTIDASTTGEKTASITYGTLTDVTHDLLEGFQTYYLLIIDNGPGIGMVGTQPAFPRGAGYGTLANPPTAAVGLGGNWWTNNFANDLPANMWTDWEEIGAWYTLSGLVPLVGFRTGWKRP